MSLRETKIWLPVLAAVIIGWTLRSFFALETPCGSDSVPGELSSYNDELAHTQYTEFVLSHSKLPSQVEAISDSDAVANGRYEYYQPPLYYIVHAGILSVFREIGPTTISLSGRLLNVLLGFGLLLAFYLIARELSLSSIETAAGLIFLSLSGVLIRFQSIDSNDALFWLLSAGIFCSTARLSNHSAKIGVWLSFVLFATLALYTKLSTLILLPLPLILVFMRRGPRIIVYWTLSFLLIALLTLPIWLRNISDFGSLLPIEAGFGAAGWRVPELASLAFAIRSLVFPWSELWQGIVGSVIIIIPLTLFIFAKAAHQSRTGENDAVLHFGLLVTILAFLWLNTRYDQAESRYLFAAWPSLTLFVSRSVGSVLGLWILIAALLMPFLLFLL
jgi:4-amino-4-deoxy-L-arabinose transferase-like glycosyltransferase